MNTKATTPRTDAELLEDFGRAEKVGFSSYAARAEMPVEFTGNEALERGFKEGVQNAKTDEAIAALGH